MTVADWNHLMTQTPTRVQDLSPFANALHLHPTIQAVVEHNVTQLQASGKAIATIKAVHAGPNASKASADDAGGLEAIICLAQSARVMLHSNLWVDVGLVNGAMGTIAAICYRSGGPPDLPVAVMVHFDKYSMMALFPLPPFAAHGLLQEPLAHVCSCPSNWPGQSPSTSRRVLHSTR